MSFFIPSFHLVWAPAWIWCNTIGNLLMAVFIALSFGQVFMALRKGKCRRVTFTHSTKGIMLLCITGLAIAINQALYVVSVVYPIIPLLALWKLTVGLLCVATHLKLQLSTIPLSGLESMKNGPDTNDAGVPGRSEK